MTKQVKTEVVRVGEFSDGDSSQSPPVPPYYSASAEIYLNKVADMWMKDTEQAEKGLKYTLERLPDGYRLFERPRTKASEGVRADKYLWGHPSGRSFDSPATFFPHFKYLMQHGDSSRSVEPCACKICSGAPRGNRQSKGSSEQPTSTRKRRKRDRSFYDPMDPKTGPDVFEAAIKKFARRGTIDVDVEDNLRFDPEIDQAENASQITRMSKDYSFQPRLGEVVLFYPEELDGEVVFEKSTGQFKIWNATSNSFKGQPLWKAGVITGLPEEKITPEDLVINSDKKLPLASSGYRVEHYPDPCNNEKGWSVNYKHVPLRQIRPYCFWGEFVFGTSSINFHETIWHGLRIMPSVSVLGRHHVEGKWPNLNVSCRAAWLGSELILIGDALRLLPPPKDNVNPDAVRPPPDSLLVLKEIHCVVKNLDNPAKLSFELNCSGKEYTTNKDKAAGPKIPDEDVFRLFPRGMWYFDFYPSHKNEESQEYPIDRILGRCYEAEAIELWMQNGKRVDSGWKGLEWSRGYGRKVDTRKEPEQTWLWASDRVEQLGLDSNSLIGVDRDDIKAGLSFIERMRRIAKVAVREASQPSPESSVAEDTRPEDKAQDAVDRQLLASSQGERLTPVPGERKMNVVLSPSKDGKQNGSDQKRPRHL